MSGEPDASLSARSDAALGGAGDTVAEVALDPLVLARIREAQDAIHRSLAVARAVLTDCSLPLHLVTGSAVLADFDLGDGIRRRAVSASLLIPRHAIDGAVRQFRRAGFNLGQPIDELEIIRRARGRRVLYSLIEPDDDSPVSSLRLPTAHPGSAEGRRQRAAFMTAIMGKQIAATLSRVRRGWDGDPNTVGGCEFADSDEFRLVPYHPE
ncbi:MAG: hypothetical protein RL136_1623 [Planctomycetota bacterium]|jgi:hypothetical protein